MPTYEYSCATCGTFEAFQGIKADALTTCPTCGGPVRRLISKGGGIIFKGSGFYQTDYRSEGYQEKAKAESAKPASDAGSTAEAKPAGEAKTTEAKPATEGKPAAESKPAASESKPAAGGSTGTTPAA